MLQDVGKFLLLVGVIILILGIFFIISPKLFPFLGKLPGDFLIKKEKFIFFFPLGTCILISIILSLLLTLFFFFFKYK